jgi:hypothetical protein
MGLNTTGTLPRNWNGSFDTVSRNLGGKLYLIIK